MVFNAHLLWLEPLTFTTFSVLACSFIAIYLFKNFFLRFGIFFAALMLGVISGHLAWQGLVFILLFGVIFYLSFHAKKQIIRRLAFVIALLGAITLMFVPVPGIHNWQLISKQSLSSSAIPYSMAFTFDKALVGLFFIWFSQDSLANGGKWQGVLLQSVLIGLGAILVLLPLAFMLGYVQFEFKPTHFFWVWAIHNLLFVSIAEEAIFRGMIQRSLMSLWEKNGFGKWVALVLTALLFGAAHFKGGLKYVILASVAGLFYGFAFLRTQKIEGSIISHFMVNSVHFLFFTYPALASAFKT